jgi:O-methyltransferase involved in polyketide biosynthesis
MTVTIDHLTPVEKTLLITLPGRALDARTKRPLLGDRLVATAFDRLGPGADIVKLPDSNRLAPPGCADFGSAAGTFAMLWNCRSASSDRHGFPSPWPKAKYRSQR